MKLLYCLGLLTITIVNGAPRSRDSIQPHTVIDQKQTGENNIHIRLKDFQIIGVFSDESFGDYDYNYDYTDFTVKPPSNSTQNSSAEASPIVSITSTTTSTTTSINTKLGTSTAVTPTEVQESSGVNANASSSTNTESAIKLKGQLLGLSNETIDLLGEKLPQEAVTTAAATTTEKPLKTVHSDPIIQSNNDKIKVHVLQSPNVAIVPADDVVGPSNEHSPALGEIMHYRRCLNGYTRDKKGRCKRIRRPGGHQLSFDLSRLASNLASRLRHSSSADSSLSSFES